MKPLWLLWLFFSVVFFGLGIWHYVQSGSAMPPFAVTQRPVPGTMKLMGLGVDKPLADFAADFNAYVATQNAASRTANRVAALGYLAAGLTALFSMWLGKEQSRSKVPESKVSTPASGSQ
jgi:hypothetical protein